MAHLNQALEVDKTSWKALQGKSKCLAHRKEFDEASQALSEALRVVPDSMKHAVWDLKNNLTNIVLNKRDFNAALHEARDMYFSNKTNCENIQIYVRALYALHDHDRIVEIVEDLREIEATSSEWKPGYFLGLRHVHHELGCSLRKRGKLDLVRP
jgi:Flp pilus assembly protein TadD